MGTKGRAGPEEPSLLQRGAYKHVEGHRAIPGKAAPVRPPGAYCDDGIDSGRDYTTWPEASRSRLRVGGAMWLPVRGHNPDRTKLALLDRTRRGRAHREALRPGTVAFRATLTGFPSHEARGPSYRMARYRRVATAPDGPRPSFQRACCRAHRGKAAARFVGPKPPVGKKKKNRFRPHT